MRGLSFVRYYRRCHVGDRNFYLRIIYAIRRSVLITCSASCKCAYSKDLTEDKKKPEKTAGLPSRFLDIFS